MKSSKLMGNPDICEVSVAEDMLDGFLSDMSEDAEEMFGNIDEADEWYGREIESNAHALPQPEITVNDTPDNETVDKVEPSCKRRRLDVPVRQARKRAAEIAVPARQSALKDIDCLLSSQHQQFEGGHNGLQAQRARAIRACLQLMVRHGQGMIQASRTVAEGNGFAQNWGSRLTRQWTRDWIHTRTLPTSRRGQHPKVASIFSDSSVRAAISTYMRSNKWSMNPEKLKKLMNNELAADEAREYAKVFVSQEMPRGLKEFLETSLLPRLHLKPSRLGLSLSTMRRVMLREGFSYMEHRKSVYFDGHERPDIVEDRQKRFVPTMRVLHPYLVKYEVGNVKQEIPVDPRLASVPRVVLVAHDEMTAQAHDGVKRSWVLDGEMPLKKKGPGRGLHQSDFICSTVGWLQEASVTLEYGKNHDEFWTGELFVNQVSINSIFRKSQRLADSHSSDQGEICACIQGKTW